MALLFPAQPHCFIGRCTQMVTHVFTFHSFFFFFGKVKRVKENYFGRQCFEVLTLVSAKGQFSCLFFSSANSQRRSDSDSVFLKKSKIKNTRGSCCRNKETSCNTSCRTWRNPVATAAGSRRSSACGWSATKKSSSPHLPFYPLCLLLLLHHRPSPYPHHPLSCRIYMLLLNTQWNEWCICYMHATGHLFVPLSAPKHTY